jgi:hypothetical protein
MSFSALAQGLAKTAIGIAGDLAPTVVYTAVAGPPVYTPATGATVTPTKTYTFNAILAKFGQNELDSNMVIATDAKLIVAALDLPVEPTTMDSMVILGKTWSMQREVGTPGQALRVLHIRAS